MPDKVGGLRVSWQQRLAARVMGKAVERPRYDSPHRQDRHSTMQIAPPSKSGRTNERRASPRCRAHGFRRHAPSRPRLAATRRDLHWLWASLGGVWGGDGISRPEVSALPKSGSFDLAPTIFRMHLAERIKMR